jgi:hypothetical protein
MTTLRPTLEQAEGSSSNWKPGHPSSPKVVGPTLLRRQSSMDSLVSRVYQLPSWVRVAPQVKLLLTNSASVQL